MPLGRSVWLRWIGGGRVLDRSLMVAVLAPPVRLGWGGFYGGVFVVAVMVALPGVDGHS